ncbi:MAG: hypothetical protein EZS28_046751, partial [Streblomastix strix]
YSGYDNNSVFLAGGGVRAISDINASVDLTDYYNKTKTDELLGDKADKTDLDSYVTLDTAQSINANKTFNNACRFTSTIDGMSTITGASFVKSGADDTVVLLGAGGTKPISEFVSAPTDLSNYYNKNETYSKTESDSKYVDMTTTQTIGGNKTFGLEVRAPTFKLLGYSSDYVVMSGAMKNKSHFVQTDEVDQTVAGTKTFSNNVTAPAFIKSDGTNQEVLLANGDVKPISEFNNQIDTSNYVVMTTDQTIGGNKIFNLEVRAPTFKLPGYNSDYVVMSGSMKIKSHFVQTDEVDQTVAGTKTFSNNVITPAFVKSGGTNQEVLLANGSSKPLSDFSGGGGDMSNYIKKVGADVQIINGILRKGEDGEESEDDALLLLKADKTDLNNYVDLISAQTVSGQKQFGVISVASVAKQDKD